jgi:hypothetical protein
VVPRLQAEHGLARLVYGLGTRAVDRTGNDYSRLVALGAPLLRPEVTPERQAATRSAWSTRSTCRSTGSRPFPWTRSSRGAGRPGLEWAASVRSEDGLSEPTGGLDGVDPGKLCVTFDRLLARTRFATLLRGRLRRLEDAYGTPINVEFAQVEDRFYLLQCRPLVQAEAAEAGKLPRGVGSDRVIFSTRGLVRSGEVRDIEHVVLVDPAAYDEAGPEERAAVSRAVARVNDALEGTPFLLLGPGRWGTNDSRLGVKVHYADINHCRVLIEIAHRRGTYVPEVSYGTHFFQDLVEDGIFYLALHPGEDGTTWRDAFFDGSPNALEQVSPQDRDLAKILRVIRIADVESARHLHLAMDGEAGRRSAGWSRIGERSCPRRGERYGVDPRT